MAIGADGTLYATANRLNIFHRARIVAFPFGSSQPSREITFPKIGEGNKLTALAVGPEGFLYAAYEAIVPDHNIGPNAFPDAGIAVYGPNASGEKGLLEAYDSGKLGAPSALAFGPAGTLYVATTGACGLISCNGIIYIVQMPGSSHRIIGHLSLGGFLASSLVFSNDFQELDVLASDFFGVYTSLFVYPAHARGRAQPFRSALFDATTPLLAVAGPFAYVSQYESPNQPAGLLGYLRYGSQIDPNPYYREKFPRVSFITGGVLGR